MFSSIPYLVKGIKPGAIKMLKYIELTFSNLVMETLSLNIALELSFILKLINFSFVSKLFC